MRIRLEVRRQNLPPVKLLWTTDGLRPGTTGPLHATTIFQLLDQVNEVIPLEVGACGLEDYVVEVQGFECLHFCTLDQILKDNEEVTIRPLEFTDVRSRRISGRHQISADGRHLIDGVAFGRPYLRPNGQPAVENGDDHETLDEPSGQLMLAHSEHASDDDDYQDEGSGIEDAGDAHVGDLADELAELAQEERQTSRRVAGRKTIQMHGNPVGQSTVRKRKRSEGLGIGGAGLSATFLPGGTPEEPLRVPKKRRSQAMALRPESLTRHSSRSSTRSVRFATDEQETPATIRPSMQSEDASDNEEVTFSSGTSSSGTVSSGSSSSQSDKENRDPASNAAPESANADSTSSSETSDDDSASSSDSNDDNDPSSSGAGAPKDASGSSNSSNQSSEPSSPSSKAPGASSSGDSSTTDSSGDSSEGPVIEHSRSTNDALSQAETSLKPSHSTAAANEPQGTQNGPAVPPGMGVSRTKGRNARRKLRERLDKLTEAEILPATSTLQDCRDWYAKFTEQEVKDRIAAAFEAKRQALLKSIDLGGIEASKEHGTDVFGASIRPEPDEAAPEPVENESTRSSTSVQPSRTRSKLDMAASKRMLFGSLGLKAPKNKLDEERIKAKLMQNVKPSVPRPSRDFQTSETITITAAEDQSWRDKVILGAIECSGRPKRLSTPPFPFVQRWHQTKRTSGGAEYHALQRASYEQEQADADLNYGDDTAQVDINSQLLKDTVDTTAATRKTEEDLPAVPEDMSSYPALDVASARPGSVIVFKQMEMSKATNWCPIVSGLRTARIRNIDDGGMITMKLAKRDHPRIDKDFDPHTGQRIYSGFEGPSFDEDDDDAIRDPGVIEMGFSELIEPFLLFSPETEAGPLRIAENSAESDPNAGETNDLPKPVHQDSSVTLVEKSALDGGPHLEDARATADSLPNESLETQPQAVLPVTEELRTFDADVAVDNILLQSDPGALKGSDETPASAQHSASWSPLFDGAARSKTPSKTSNPMATETPMGKGGDVGENSVFFSASSQARGGPSNSCNSPEPGTKDNAIEIEEDTWQPIDILSGDSIHVPPSNEEVEGEPAVKRKPVTQISSHGSQALEDSAHVEAKVPTLPSTQNASSPVRRSTRRRNPGMRSAGAVLRSEVADSVPRGASPDDGSSVASSSIIVSSVKRKRSGESEDAEEEEPPISIRKSKRMTGSLLASSTISPHRMTRSAKNSSKQRTPSPPRTRSQTNDDSLFLSPESTRAHEHLPSINEASSQVGSAKDASIQPQTRSHSYTRLMQSASIDLTHLSDDSESSDEEDTGGVGLPQGPGWVRKSKSPAKNRTSPRGVVRTRSDL